MILATRESNPESDSTMGAAAEASLLNGIVALPRLLALYPPTHRRIEEHVSRLHGMLELTLDAVSELALRVDGGSVMLGDRQLQIPRTLAERFGALLRHRGLETLVLRPGLEKSELFGLGQFLASDPRVVAERENAASLPHVELRAARHETREAEAGEVLEPVDDAIARVVEETLSKPGIADRAHHIRELLAERMQSEDLVEEGLLERLILRYLADHQDLAPDVVEYAVDSFLDSLGLLMEADEDTTNGALSMEQCVWELLRQSFETAMSRGREPAPAEGTNEGLAYDRFDPDALEGWTALAWKALDKQIEEHNAESASFLIHCEMLAASANASHYKVRSRRLRAALQGGTYPAAAVVEGIGHLRTAMVRKHREDGERFIRTLIPHTSDQSALVELLGSLEGVHWHDARELVRQLALRDDSFALLGMLVRAPIPRVLRVEVVKALSDLAKARPETWLSLTRQQPQILLDMEVLRELMVRAAELLGPATREILLRGKPHAKSKLIRNLKEIGGRFALRLLVLGLRHGTDERDLELIEALGSFRQPLAVGALKEVVHRCNTTKSGIQEAESAMRALKAGQTPDAQEFFREVASKKVWGGHVYRRDLRRLAKRYLKGSRAA